MATYTFTDTNTILKGFALKFDSDDKTMFKQPSRKLIPFHNLVFKNSKKHQKNSVWISMKAISSSSSSGEIIAIVGPSGPEISNDVMPSVVQERSSRIYSCLIPRILSASILINSSAFLMLIVTATIAVSFLKLLLQIPPISWKWQQHHISTVNGQKCQFKFGEPSLTPRLGEKKVRKICNTTSGGSARKWVLDFLCPTDVYDIEVFCLIVAILLAFGLLSELYCYISRMFFPRNYTE